MSFEFTRSPYTLKAVSSANGRPYDEDRFRFLACKGAIFIIVLDGHGGDMCVNTITGSLEEIIARIFTFLDFTDIQLMLNATEQIYMELTNLTNECTSGSCMAMTIILPDNTMIASHLGDCRIYVFNHQIMYMSQDHDPISDKDGVRARGGRVSFLNGPRLVGGLAVARAFGDKNIKGVGRQPTIQLVGKNWNQFLITSDCLTNAINTNERNTNPIEPHLDEEGQPILKPFHEIQAAAEPAVTEKIIKIFSSALLGTETKDEAMSVCVASFIEQAKTYPDNYTIVCCSRL
jgi:serine/threonine protein phosphatase PrpC